MEKLFDLFVSLWYHFIGYASCHQFPERIPVFSGRELFVCYRCSGIYTGYFISYVYIYITGKAKARQFPSKNVVWTGILVSSLMFLDVFSVILGLRDGSNDIRMLTGLFAGASLPFVVFPIFNRFFPHNSTEERVINGIPFLLIIVLDLIVFFIIKTGSLFLFWPLFFIIVSGLVLIYINVNAIFLFLFFQIVIFNRLSSIIKLNIWAFIASFLELLAVYFLYKTLGIK